MNKNFFGPTRESETLHIPTIHLLYDTEHFEHILWYNPQKTKPRKSTADSEAVTAQV